MNATAFLRIKKLTGKRIITVAARHNRREIQAELGANSNIDAARTHLNETLQGPPDAVGVGALAKDLLAAAGVVKLRKDAVMGLEVLFSLPPNLQLDDRAYFSDCAAWASVYFAGAPVLSIDIHRDEAAPHCHVLLLPLVAGRMVGSDLFGGRQKLMAMSKHFHAAVAAHYGLSRVQEKRLRTMAEIFTSPGKGPRTEVNPIGFQAPRKDQTLSRVGFASRLPSSPATHQPLIDKSFADWLAGAVEQAMASTWAQMA